MNYFSLITSTITNLLYSPYTLYSYINNIMGCTSSTYRDPDTPDAKRLRKIDPKDISTVFHQKKRIHARIIKVYDGDTCTALINVGTEVIKIRLRLARIDTPELKDEPGHKRSRKEKNLAEAAQKRLSELVLEKIIQIEIQSWDKYGGRVVAELYININGKETTASSVLLEEGYAHEYNGGKKTVWKL